jgi:hypothetical protein
MANKKHIRLNSARDAHKLLSKMINERRRKEIDTLECRDVGYLLRILLDSLKAVELEDRIENLEKAKEIKINYPMHSEEDELRIIAWLRERELQALNASAIKDAEEQEVIEVIPQVPDG